VSVGGQSLFSVSLEANMPLAPILAQMDGRIPSVESVFGFMLPTIAFLLLCGAVLRWGRRQASKLLALGILVAVLSVGYGAMIATPMVAILAPGLMKIAIILILGGVACSVLPILRGSSTTETPNSEQPHHEA
jgi:hypothetical protein